MTRSRQAQVESRIRWDEVLGRIAREVGGEPPAARRLGPWIAVSRQAASGGAEVARLVGERLGWAVLDKCLVEELASTLEVDPAFLALMDETRSNWFEETLLNLLDSRLVLQDSYVGLLGRIMLLAACRGSVVFVGRGANLLLPPEGGLRVRVVAPRAWRIERQLEIDGTDARRAAAMVDEIDRARSDFTRRHFRCSPDDPDAYDLAIDSASFGFDGAADLILQAARLRRLLPATAPADERAPVGAAES